MNEQMRIHKSERDDYDDSYNIKACGWSFIPDDAYTIGDVDVIEGAAEACWKQAIESKLLFAQLEGYNISIDDISISVSEDWCYGTQHEFNINCEAHHNEIKAIQIVKECIAEANENMMEMFATIFDNGIAYDCVEEWDYDEEDAA